MSWSVNVVKSSCHEASMSWARHVMRRHCHRSSCHEASMLWSRHVIRRQCREVAMSCLMSWLTYWQDVKFKLKETDPNWLFIFSSISQPRGGNVSNTVQAQSIELDESTKQSTVSEQKKARVCGVKIQLLYSTEVGSLRYKEIKQK